MQSRTEKVFHRKRPASTPIHPDRRRGESSRYGQYPCGFAAAPVGRLDADPGHLLWNTV
jgi:hypothetical protein